MRNACQSASAFSFDWRSFRMIFRSSFLSVFFFYNFSFLELLLVNFYGIFGITNVLQDLLVLELTLCGLNIPPLISGERKTFGFHIFNYSREKHLNLGTSLNTVELITNFYVKTSGQVILMALNFPIYSSLWGTEMNSVSNQFMGSGESHFWCFYIQLVQHLFIYI